MYRANRILVQVHHISKCPLLCAGDKYLALTDLPGTIIKPGALIPGTAIGTGQTTNRAACESRHAGNSDLFRKCKHEKKLFIVTLTGNSQEKNAAAEEFLEKAIID